MSSQPIKFRDKWRIRWVDHSGKRQSQVFTSRRDAELALAKKKIETYEVKTGLRKPTAPSMTFRELADYWESNRVPLKRSGHHDISILKSHLRPFFADMPIHEIKPIHAENLRRKLSDRSDKTVHNILTLLISMLTAAFEQDWLEKIPAIKKPKIKVLDKDFRYLKTEEEIKRFLKTAKLFGENVYDLYHTAIHTGLRAGELGQLKFSHVDFDRNIIYIYGSWDGLTKSGEVRMIPLLSSTKEIFLRRKIATFSEFIFYNTRGLPLGPSDRIFQETLKKVLDQAGFPKVMIKGKEKHYMTFHGSRHTYASHSAMRGIQMWKLQKSLGHQDAKMTERYSHLAPEAFQEIHDKGLNISPSEPEAQIIKLPR
jgi:integrase